MWKSYPDGDSVGSTTNLWSYDSAGRLSAVPGLITSTTYNARGQVTSISYPNGISTAYTYDAARGWLASVVTTRNGTTVQSLTYTRNAKGMITAVSYSDYGFAEAWSYTYEALNTSSQPRACITPRSRRASPIRSMATSFR